MPPRLTPMERYIRRDPDDRRAKYEAKRAALGLTRCTVWVPAADIEKIKSAAADAVEAWEAQIRADLAATEAGPEPSN